MSIRLSWKCILFHILQRHCRQFVLHFSLLPLSHTAYTFFFLGEQNVAEGERYWHGHKNSEKTETFPILCKFQCVYVDFIVLIFIGFIFDVKCVLCLFVRLLLPTLFIGPRCLSVYMHCAVVSFSMAMENGLRIKFICYPCRFLSFSPTLGNLVYLFYAMHVNGFCTPTANCFHYIVMHGTWLCLHRHE